MASIIKRGDSWRAMVVKRGQRVSATFDSKREAEEWAVQAEAAILSGQKAAEVQPVSSRMAVSALMTRYAQEVSPSKRGERWEVLRLAKLARDPAFSLSIHMFGPVELAAWRDRRLSEVSAYSVNRELNLVSAVFNQAIKEWQAPIKINPVHNIQRPKNPRPRTRRVTERERNLIIARLGWDMESVPENVSQWTAFTFCLGIETAMRKGEMLSLVWRNVHTEQRWLHLPMTKNGEARDVPLSSAAASLLSILPRRGDDMPVIPANYGSMCAYFRNARSAVGLDTIRFHDARREAITRMSKKLSNVLELSAVSGHKSLTVLKGYYRPDASDLAKKLD